jgi:hypothetical protein
VPTGVPTDEPAASHYWYWQSADVYGAAPPAVLISGGALGMNMSENMTETGERCAARMAELAINLLTAA